jgi:hypothetical protein
MEPIELDGHQVWFSVTIKVSGDFMGSRGGSKRKLVCQRRGSGATGETSDTRKDKKGYANPPFICTHAKYLVSEPSNQETPQFQFLRSISLGATISGRNAIV